MPRIIKNLLHISLPLLFLAFLQDACKKKEVFPGQQLPEIKSIFPSSAITGTPVVIKGINLKNVDRVQFGTADAAGFDSTANKDTSINVVVPDSLPVGNLFVQVYLKNGGGYSAFKFTVALTPPVPKIDSVSPATAYPGDQVTVAGTNFGMVTSVTVGGIAASFAPTLDTNGKMTVIIPWKAGGGDQFITLINPNGKDSIPFNVNIAPVITTVIPGLGAIGDVITVKGYRFTGATSVKVSGTTAIYTVTNDSTLTFTVPTGAATGMITVTTPNGTGTSSGSFTVQGSVAEFFIYDDALAANWWIGGTPPAAGWSNTTSFTNTTPVKGGTNSISITYDAGGYGGFQVGYNSPGFSLATYSVVKISIYRGPGTDGNKLQFYLNGGNPPPNPVMLIIKQGVWTDFVIPLASLGSPTSVTEFDLQEFSGKSEAIYLDNIGLQ